MNINIEKVNKNTYLGFLSEEEIVKYAKTVLDYLTTHNKNYTKEQNYKLQDLREIMEAVEV